MTAAPMHNAQHTKARVPSVYYRARPPLCHPQRGRGAVLHLQGQRAHDQGAQRQGRGDSRHQQVSAFPFFVAVGRYISASHWRHRACLPRRVGLRLCGIRGSGVSVGGLGSLRSSRNNAPANMHLTPLYSPPTPWPFPLYSFADIHPSEFAALYKGYKPKRVTAATESISHKMSNSSLGTFAQVGGGSV